MLAVRVDRLQPQFATTALDGLSVVTRNERSSGDGDGSSNDHFWKFDGRQSCSKACAASSPASDSIHQTGMRYSSNSAGDGPEKTRDRKSWFPRFKSNWLGTFRSKQMFQCCECAVMPTSGSGSSLSSQAGRYKGAEGKHCRCGKDQWHLAKSVEEAEYNRRMEISKALGGMRYDEAVLRLRSMGQSELDFKPSEHVVSAGSPTQAPRAFGPSSSSSSLQSANAPKRIRSVSSGPLPSQATRSYAAPQLMKPELSTMPAGTPQVYAYDNPTKPYGVYSPVYGNNGIEYTQHAQPHGPAEYEQLAPAPFGDEEGFGELLQGILEDDPRVAGGAGTCLSPNPGGAYAGNRYGYYVGTAPANGTVAPLKRTMSMPSYGMTPSMVASPPRGGVEQEFFADPSRRASLNLGVNPVPSYVSYQQPLQQQQPQMQQYSYQQQQEQQSLPQVYSRPLSTAPSTMATTTSASFS